MNKRDFKNKQDIPVKAKDKGRETKATKKSGSQTKNTRKKEKLILDIPQWMWTAGVTALFAVFAVIMLIVKNGDLLYTAQDRSIFLSTPEFFAERMAVPGGLLHWVSCYFIQYFINPWWGGTMLIIVWLATLLLTIKVFDLKGCWTVLALLPVLALLASVIDLGYWIYYLKYPGYWFNASIGVLVIMAALWVIKKFRGTSVISQLSSLIFIILFAVIGYIVMGWLAVLGLLLILAYRDSSLISRIASLVMIVAVPWATYYFYSQYRLEDAWWVGFPLFQSDKLDGWYAAIPLLVMILVLIVLAVMKNRLPKINATVPALTLTGLAVIVMGVLTYEANINDYNYHAELRMHRAAMEQRWDDVLEESAANPGEPSREIVLLKNLALAEKNEFGDKFCKYDNGGQLPYLRDSIRVRLVHTCGPLLYMYYGKENFATRWCIENEVEFGQSINRLKVLSYASLIAREPQLAAKYLNILKQTKFHREWAERYEPILKDTALAGNAKRYPEFAYTKELYDNFKTVLDADEGLVEMYLINYFSNTQNVDSKAMATTTLNFSCISKDIQKFWPKFMIYAQLLQIKDGTDMPINYQEAAYLYTQLEPQTAPMQNMPFDQQRIVQRYQAFTQMSQAYLRQGMTPEQVGVAMKDAFGDTFWWFYFFCRDVKSY